MSRLPGERAPVSALSSARLASSGGARVRGRERSRRSLGQRQFFVGVQLLSTLSAWRVTRLAPRFLSS